MCLEHEPAAKSVPQTILFLFVPKSVAGGALGNSPKEYGA
jgi:hypothetical protein